MIESFVRHNIFMSLIFSCFSFFLTVIPESDARGFNRTEFETYLRERLISLFTGTLPGKEDEIFSAIDMFYSFQPFINDMDLNREAMNRVWPMVKFLGLFVVSFCFDCN